MSSPLFSIEYAATKVNATEMKLVCAALVYETKAEVIILSSFSKEFPLIFSKATDDAMCILSSEMRKEEATRSCVLAKGHIESLGLTKDQEKEYWKKGVIKDSFPKVKELYCFRQPGLETDAEWKPLLKRIAGALKAYFPSVHVNNLVEAEI